MMLFDEIERTDTTSAKHKMKEYEYLNVSARPEAEDCRATVEEWFLTFPQEEKEEIKARICSNDDRQFQSAFFELFLYRLLTKIGCNVEIHPSMKGDTLKTPDFLVTSSKGGKFYLEATVATDMTDDEVSSGARKSVVYDSINKLDSPNFFIGMKLAGDPQTPPPGKKIGKFLSAKLKGLDPDIIVAEYKAKGNDGLPTWEYHHDGWAITFFPIPKKAEARGKSGTRPIGLQFFGARWINSSASIRNSIEKKAARYGDLEYPYIVAINALGVSVDRESVMEATLGKEQVILNVAGSEPSVDRVERDWNGAWILGQKPKNTRVSGVLVGKRLSPWSYLERELVLYLNPWAQKPYSSDLCTLPRFKPEDGIFKFCDGQNIMGIFES